MEKVSIIVPYFKGPSYLEECIHSIEEQQCEDYEILLINDKDGDDVPETVLNKDTVITIDLASSKQPENMNEEGPKPFGVAVARNVGIEKSTGKYIYFLDADDYLLEGTLKRLIALAEQKKAMLVTSSKASSWFRPMSFDWERATKEADIEGIHLLDDTLLKERFMERFSAGGLLLRRDFVLENHLLFDKENQLYSDSPFVIAALLKSGDKKWIDGDCYYIMRNHNDSINLPALKQYKSEMRNNEYLSSYEAIMRQEGIGQSVLCNIVKTQFCAFVVNRFPSRIRGDIIPRFSKILRSFNDKAVINQFTFLIKIVLKLIAKGKYRRAKPIALFRRAIKKKRGILGTPIQYHRFFDKHIFHKLPLKENWILIESFFGKGYSDSPKYLYEHLLETRGKKYRYIWCLNQKSKDVKGSPTIVKRFGLRYVYYTARCKYQIYNTRQPQWLEKREGMVFLETWHGTPLKKLVFDLDDIHSASQNHKVMFYKQSRDWDYLISANPFSTKIFESAFMYPREQILEYGYPRNDILYAKNKETIAKEVKKKLHIPEGKRIILYAPTWRDDQYYGKGKYKFSLELDLPRMKKEFGHDSILLLRTHYHIADNLELTGVEDFVVDGSKYGDISELYLISDVCITDYSSVFFDYANLKRPILFFVYDYESYKDEIRGLYIDMEKDLPGPLLETNDELMEALHHLDEMNEKYKECYDEFYQRFCSVDDGNACKRTIDKVFGSEGDD